MSACRSATPAPTRWRGRPARGQTNLHRFMCKYSSRFACLTILYKKFYENRLTRFRKNEETFNFYDVCRGN